MATSQRLFQRHQVETQCQKVKPRLPPMNALPESNGGDHLRQQLSVVMPPQKLKVGVIEERTGVGGTLTGMSTMSAELKAEIG